MRITTKAGPITVGQDAAPQLRDRRKALFKSIDLLHHEIGASDYEHAEKSFTKHARAVQAVKDFDAQTADLVAGLERKATACEKAGQYISGKSTSTRWTNELPANVVDSVLFLHEFRVAHPKEAEAAAKQLKDFSLQLGDIAVDIFYSTEKSLNLLPALVLKAEHALALKQAAHEEAEVRKALSAPDGLLTHAKAAEAAWLARKDGPDDWKKDNAHKLFAKALDRLAGAEFTFNTQQKQLLDAIETKYTSAMVKFRQAAGRPAKTDYQLGAKA